MLMMLMLTLSCSRALVLYAHAHDDDDDGVGGVGGGGGGGDVDDVSMLEVPDTPSLPPRLLPSPLFSPPQPPYHPKGGRIGKLLYLHMFVELVFVFSRFPILVQHFSFGFHDLPSWYSVFPTVEVSVCVCVCVCLSVCACLRLSVIFRYLAAAQHGNKMKRNAFLKGEK